MNEVCRESETVLLHRRNVGRSRQARATELHDQRACAQAAEVEESRKIQFEDRFGDTHESNVAAEFEVMLAVNDVDVVGELITRFGAHHRREEFATDKRGTGDVESNRVAVL